MLKALSSLRTTTGWWRSPSRACAALAAVLSWWNGEIWFACIMAFSFAGDPARVDHMKP
jgi:hypothetical protein